MLTDTFIMFLSLCWTLCVSFLFKLTVSSLRKRDHFSFSAYLYSLLPTMTHDTNVQFREYRSLEGDTICVCAFAQLCGSLTSFYLSCYESGNIMEPQYLLMKFSSPDRVRRPLISRKSLLFACDKRKRK